MAAHRLGRDADRILDGFAGDAPWQMITTPLTPSSGAPPYVA